MSDSIYPVFPGYKAPGPSEDAAKAFAPIAATLRDQVREAIANFPSGITADEVADVLHRSVLSVRPRVSELKREGMIRASGARGRNSSGMSATIWILAGSATADFCGRGEQ